jgi:hypothetical protein
LAASCTLERPSYNDIGTAVGTAASHSATADASQGSPNATATVASSAVTPHASATVKPAVSGSSNSTPDNDGGSPEPSSTTIEPGPDGSTGPNPVETSGPGPTTTAAPTATAPDVDGGTVVPAGETVNGRVIDFHGRPLPGIEVQIGGVTAETNDQGEFAIADVAATYTADFRVNRNGNANAPYIWRYIGLTRRDPTLQSFQSSLPERSTGIVVMSDLPDDSTDEIAVAFGSDQGSQRKSLDSSGIDTSIDWAGPSALAAKGHALVKHLTDSIPTGYGAYEARDFSFSDGADLTWDLEVSGLADITAGNVSGTVTVDDEQYRTNYGFVRFSSNGVLNLFDTQQTTAAFTHLVPSIPNGSILLLADNTGNQDYSGAYAYRQNLGPNQIDVNIHIPAPAKLKAPLLGDTVEETTEFRWTTDSAVSVVHVEDTELYRGVYIVTSKKSLTGAEVAAQAFRKGQNHFWGVSTHGDCPSVDECAGPDGALDPLYYYDGGEIGPVKRDGSATWTDQIGFVTAP